jgi:hypothetical protein
MIYKPSEVTPLSSFKLAEIYTEAGVPPGVFNVVSGAAETGKLLVEREGVDKVSFTGSTSTGQRILNAAAPGIKEVTLELGGKTPLIIFDDCSLESAVHGALLANFYTQGEVCTHGTRVYVHDSIYDEFLERACALTAELVVGDPTDPSTHIGALVSEAHMQKVLHYIDLGKKSGARLVCGGDRETSGELRNGFFVQPTIFADCHNSMQHARDEIFGPVMSVFGFRDEDEVVALANDTEFGLAAGIFTQSLARAHRVIARLQVSAGSTPTVTHQQKCLLAATSTQASAAKMASSQFVITRNSRVFTCRWMTWKIRLAEAFYVPKRPAIIPPIMAPMIERTIIAGMAASAPLIIKTTIDMKGILTSTIVTSFPLLVSMVSPGLVLMSSVSQQPDSANPGNRELASEKNDQFDASQKS